MFDLSEQEVESYRKVFELFDKDSNGTINRQEMVEVFDQLNIKLSDDQIDDIFKRFDQNGNYSIEFDQFVSILSKYLFSQAARLKRTNLKLMDHDCDGRLTKVELMKVIRLYGLQISEKEVSQLLQMFENGQGKGINYEEFSSLLKF